MATKPTAANMVIALASMEMAHRASIIALVKALEETGAVDAGYYEHLLRILSAAIAKRGEPGAAMLLDELADAMNRDEGQAH